LFCFLYKSIAIRNILMLRVFRCKYLVVVYLKHTRTIPFLVEYFRLNLDLNYISLKWIKYKKPVLRLFVY